MFKTYFYIFVGKYSFLTFLNFICVKNAYFKVFYFLILTSGTTLVSRDSLLLADRSGRHHDHHQHQQLMRMLVIYL